MPKTNIASRPQRPWRRKVTQSPNETQELMAFRRIPDTSLQRSLQARWEDVQARTEKDKHLRRPEIDHIRDSSFNTPEQVLADLQRLERDGLSDDITRLLVQIYPCLESMSDCYLLLLKTSPALDIELSFFYGLLHLVINVSNSLALTQSRKFSTCDVLTRQECHELCRNFCQVGRGTA